MSRRNFSATTDVRSPKEERGVRGIGHIEHDPFTATPFPGGINSPDPIARQLAQRHQFGTEHGIPVERRIGPQNCLHRHSSFKERTDRNTESKTAPDPQPGIKNLQNTPPYPHFTPLRPITVPPVPETLATCQPIARPGCHQNDGCFSPPFPTKKQGTFCFLAGKLYLCSPNCTKNKD